MPGCESSPQLRLLSSLLCSFLGWPGAGGLAGTCAAVSQPGRYQTRALCQGECAVWNALYVPRANTALSPARQSHNHCLKREALSLGHLDPAVMSRHSALRLLEELHFPQHGCLRTVPRLCPCSPWPARALGISALTYCSSFSVLGSYSKNSPLR